MAQYSEILELPLQIATSPDICTISLNYENSNDSGNFSPGSTYSTDGLNSPVKHEQELIYDQSSRIVQLSQEKLHNIQEILKLRQMVNAQATEIDRLKAGASAKSPGITLCQLRCEASHLLKLFHGTVGKMGRNGKTLAQIDKFRTNLSQLFQKVDEKLQVWEANQLAVKIELDFARDILEAANGTEKTAKIGTTQNKALPVKHTSAVSKDMNNNTDSLEKYGPILHSYLVGSPKPEERKTSPRKIIEINLEDPDLPPLPQLHFPLGSLSSPVPVIPEKRKYSQTLHNQEAENKRFKTATQELRNILLAKNPIPAGKNIERVIRPGLADNRASITL